MTQPTALRRSPLALRFATIALLGPIAAASAGAGPKRGPTVQPKGGSATKTPAKPSILGATIFATTQAGHLVSFDATSPGTLVTDVAITGLGAQEALVAIDFRPSNGLLYALTTDPSGERIVTLNTATGAATVVSAGFAAATAGNLFGFDVNPVTDRLRETTDTDQSRRFNPIDGSLVATDTNLSYVTGVGDPNEGQDPAVEHVAYDRNVTGALLTTLFGIDTNRDVLVRIGSVDGSPTSPNTGLLTTIGSLGAGIFPTSLGGFDIQGGTGTAYAALFVDGLSGLYTINLTTGAATLVGNIGPFGTVITGLSVNGTSVPVELQTFTAD